MTEGPCIVLCTVPDTATGEALGRHLVENGLAACVNLVPGLTSIYRWQQRVEQAAETLLLIKTHSDRFTELCQTIQRLHPYELPEIVAVPLTAGLPAYLDWITQSLDHTP